jgi:hypothetical protein
VTCFAFNIIDFFWFKFNELCNAFFRTDYIHVDSIVP